MLLERGEVRGGHMKAHKFHLVHSKNTLVQVNCEAMISAELKDLLKMMLMRNKIWRIDENIIQIDKTKGMVTKDTIYHSLERLSCIPKAKKETQEIEQAKRSNNNSLDNILISLRNLIVSLLHVHLG